MGEIQVELIFSLIISTVLAIFFIYAGKKVKAADPTARPKGVVLVVETGVQCIAFCSAGGWEDSFDIFMGMLRTAARCRGLLAAARPLAGGEQDQQKADAHKGECFGKSFHIYDHPFLFICFCDGFGFPK